MPEPRQKPRNPTNQRGRQSFVPCCRTSLPLWSVRRIQGCCLAKFLCTGCCKNRPCMDGKSVCTRGKVSMLFFVHLYKTKLKKWRKNLDLWYHICLPTAFSVFGRRKGKRCDTPNALWCIASWRRASYLRAILRARYFDRRKRNEKVIEMVRNECGTMVNLVMFDTMIGSGIL